MSRDAHQDKRKLSVISYQLSIKKENLKFKTDYFSKVRNQDEKNSFLFTGKFWFNPNILIIDDNSQLGI
jgi:hypothetical protein